MCPGWLLAGWPWLAADLLVAVGWLGPVETPLERPRGACRGQLVQRAYGRRQRGYGRTNTKINTKQRLCFGGHIARETRAPQFTT
jgi:hypothetical protein